MNHHYLKILPEHYNNVLQGTKTFEIRNNDRAFQKGDLLTMYWWPKDADNKCAINWYSENAGKKSLEFRIGDVYPIDLERVVFSLIKEEYGNKIND